MCVCLCMCDMETLCFCITVNNLDDFFKLNFGGGVESRWSQYFFHFVYHWKIVNTKWISLYCVIAFFNVGIVLLFCYFLVEMQQLWLPGSVPIKTWYVYHWCCQGGVSCSTPYILWGCNAFGFICWFLCYINRSLLSLFTYLINSLLSYFLKNRPAPSPGWSL